MEKINFKLVISICLIVTMLLGVCSALAVEKDYVAVNMTVTYNGKTLKNGESLQGVKPGEKITVNASCSDSRALSWSQNTNFMQDKGYTFNREGMAFIGYLFDSTDKTKYIDDYKNPTSITITIPEFEAGSEHYVVINAVAACDGLVDNGKEIQATSGTFAVRFFMQSKDAPVETITLDLSKDSSQITAKATITNGEFSKFVYSSDGGDNKEYTTNPMKIALPTSVGTHTLKVTVYSKSGGTKTGTLTHVVKEDPVDPLEGTISAKIGNTTLSTNKNNPSDATVDDDIVVNFTPTENFGLIQYNWDDGENKNLPASGTIKVPDFEPGTTHKLTIEGNLKDGGKVKSVYYITIPKDDAGELDIDPWMRDNNDASGLIISLRSRSQDKKDNMNFFMLDEEITYLVDYKNCGRDIKDEVKVELKLPLNFEVVDKDGGTVKDKSIIWTYKNGMEKEYENTKTVIIKYKAFSKKSYDSEMIYPQAIIYKANKKQDISTVIQYIYEDEDTEIDELHRPYMFGDAEKPTFRPDSSISRAEGALVLLRIFGVDYKNVNNITTKYSDIGDTYLEAQKAITKATELKIIDGYTDGTYKPNKEMTRAEFMKIIAAYIEESAEEDGLNVKTENAVVLYKNSSNKDHWAVPYVTLLVRLNMTSVSSKEKDLRIDDYITRAEVAQLCNYFLFRAPAKITSKVMIDFTDVSRNHKLIGDIVEATRKEHSFTITDDGKEVVK